MKWLFKTACLLIIAGTLFIFVMGYLSATSYTNRLPDQRPNAMPYVALADEKREMGEQKEQKQHFKLQLSSLNQLKKDWHDYAAMKADAERVGFGEQGKRAANNDESTRELERKMSLENGFNAYVSDMMSVNRSLPDIRYEG